MCISNGGDKMFKVIKKVEPIIESNSRTYHLAQRIKRVWVAEELIRKENGIIIGAYEVDTDHENGHEVHVVYNNGIVKIYNQKTKKYITCLIARLPQIERYGIVCTKTMKSKIKRHINDGLNQI